MPKLLFTFISCFFITFQALADEQASLDGLWEGSVAGESVVVMFYGDAPGYFYTKNLKPIDLARDALDKNDMHWVESVDKKISGSWTLEVQSTKRISGVWQSLDKKQKHTIALRKINSFPELDYTNIKSVITAQKQKIVYGKVVSFNKNKYRTIAAGTDNNSIQLIGNSKNLNQLNTLLKMGLYSEIANYFSCPSELELGRGKNAAHNYYSDITIKYLDKNWIVLEHTASGYCGGAHPFADAYRKTINLNTLEKTDLNTWISPNKEPRATEDPRDPSFLPSKLLKLIANKAIRQRHAGEAPSVERDECDEVLQNNEDYLISLGNNGLVFSTNFPHVIYACSDDIEINYSELKPYLSTEGKKAIKSIKNQ